jgi:hypothetical protein
VRLPHPDQRPLAAVPQCDGEDAPAAPQVGGARAEHELLGGPAHHTRMRGPGHPVDLRTAARRPAAVVDAAGVHGRPGRVGAGQLGGVARHVRRAHHLQRLERAHSHERPPATAVEQLRGDPAARTDRDAPDGALTEAVAEDPPARVECHQARVAEVAARQQGHAPSADRSRVGPRRPLELGGGREAAQAGRPAPARAVQERAHALPHLPVERAAAEPIAQHLDLSAEPDVQGAFDPHDVARISLLRNRIGRLLRHHSPDQSRHALLDPVARVAVRAGAGARLAGPGHRECRRRQQGDEEQPARGHLLPSTSWRTDPSHT